MGNLFELLLTTRVVAEELGVSESLLKRWRSTGQGPRFVMLGARMVRYRRADLQTYMEDLRQKSCTPEVEETRPNTQGQAFEDGLFPGWDIYS